MQSKIAELLHQYFELGVAEGREGRNHDTEAGDAQRVLSEIEAQIAALSAAEPQPAPSVAVKDLEWQKQAMSHGYGLFIRLARTSIGDYQISHGAAGKYEVYLNKDPISASYDGVHEAKAAAQADYEARIRSALSAQVQDVAIPEGWQLVPKEPTDEMHNAARDWAVKKYGLGIGRDGSDGCYRAMLAAAPAKQEG